MSKHSDTLPSTFPVANKSGYLKRPLSAAATSPTLKDLQSRLTADRSIIADTVPLVIPVRLPSIGQRVALYEAAGAIKQAMFYDPDGGEDDLFSDLLDDLPEDGLTPYELSEHEVTFQAELARKAKKLAADRIAKRKATPSPADAAKGPKATAAASDAVPVPSVTPNPQ